MSPRVFTGTLWPTLVVSEGEVGVVGGLWGQAVVEALSASGIVRVYGRHCPDELQQKTQTTPPNEPMNQSLNASKALLTHVVYSF